FLRRKTAKSSTALPPEKGPEKNSERVCTRCPSPTWLLGSSALLHAPFCTALYTLPTLSCSPCSRRPLPPVPAVSTGYAHVASESAARKAPSCRSESCPWASSPFVLAPVRFRVDGARQIFSFPCKFQSP